MSSSPIGLSRDVRAVQIPAGVTAVLPAGTVVELVQSLGGSYTVSGAGGLFRIAGEDADAIGLEPAPSSAPEKRRAPAGPVDEEKVYEALRGCYDPEIPVNIVDLGLIYDLQIQPVRGGGHRVSVKMTLTAPGCGMGPSIASDARRLVQAVPGVAEAEVQVVWDPPWCSDMMSDAAKRQLGVR